MYGFAALHLTRTRKAILPCNVATLPKYLNNTIVSNIFYEKISTIFMTNFILFL
jgi:hypothetical protein